MVSRVQISRDATCLQHLQTQLHFQEHLRSIKTDNPQSAYMLHTLKQQHDYGLTNDITPN